MTQNTPEQLDEKDLLKKAELLARLHPKHGRTHEVGEAEDLERYLESLLDEIPREELRREEMERIEIYRSGKFNKSTMRELVQGDVKLILLSYMDGRKYLRMPNREFIEYKIYKQINEMVGKEALEIEDLYKIARINFDLNGLKAMNDIGGHASGNDGLSIFSNILKNGETVTWLASLGIKSVASAEGGDEFGLFVYGDKDLRPLIQEIGQRFHDEVSRAKADHLIDFRSLKNRQVLSDMGIDIPDDFKFKLGTSVGLSTFGEALSLTNLTGNNYKEMVKKIINNMFRLADEKAIIDKKEIKSKLKETDPALYALYSRLISIEDTPAAVKTSAPEKEPVLTNEDLIKKLQDAEKKIAQLEAGMLSK